MRRAGPFSLGSFQSVFKWEYPSPLKRVCLSRICAVRATGPNPSRAGLQNGVYMGEFDPTLDAFHIAMADLSSLG